MPLQYVYSRIATLADAICSLLSHKNWRKRRQRIADPRSAIRKSAKLLLIQLHSVFRALMFLRSGSLLITLEGTLRNSLDYKGWSLLGVLFSLSLHAGQYYHGLAGFLIRRVLVIRMFRYNNVSFLVSQSHGSSPAGFRFWTRAFPIYRLSRLWLSWADVYVSQINKFFADNFSFHV